MPTVVIKIGTSSICNEHTQHPRLALLSQLVETVVRLRGNGFHVVLVSSGAIGVGRRVMGTINKHSLDSTAGESTKPQSAEKTLAVKQAFAAIGQGRLMALYDQLFSLFGQPIAQILLTRDDIADRNRYLNACNTFRELLAMGVVPIVNENDTVSVSEIRFGDNDTLSAITAAMVNAEALFLLTDVDSLYTANPRRDPNATPIPRVENLDSLATQASFEGSGSSMGTGGMATKIAAARLATTAGVHCVVKSSETPGAIIEIIEELGRHDEDCDSARTSRYTHFVAQPRPASQRRVRKWWIAHGMVPRGRIHVDDGAYRALLHFDMASVSLFAVGVTCVEGDFQAQDCVSVVHEKDGVMVEVARGLVNYSSTEMKRICGIRSEEIPRVLGCVDAESVIHRYNLVVLGQGVSAPAAVAERM